MSYGYQPWDPRQCALLPVDPSEWLPEDHLARIILDVVETFDLRGYRRSTPEARGAAGFDPSMMVVVVLYCMLNKHISARAMEWFITSDLGGRFLCSAGGVPGWRCIAAFRRRHSNDLGRLFAQSFDLCCEAKLVDMSAIFGDGSKFEAYASTRRNVSYGRADQTLERLTKAFEGLLAEADRLDQEEDKAEEAEVLRRKAEGLIERKRCIAEAKVRIEERARAEKEEWDTIPTEDRHHRKVPTGVPSVHDRLNTTEPESRLMKFNDGGFRQGYNVQVAVEGSNQIIVGVSVSNDCTDYRQLFVTVESVRETTQCLPDVWVADGGYLSEENIRYLEDMSIEPIICPNRRQDKDVIPAGSVPQGSEQGAKDPRQSSWAQIRMSEKLATDEGRKMYKRRCHVVEPVFGQIKGSPGRPGMDRFTVRGLENCRNVMLLQAAVHNIGKYIRRHIADTRKRRPPQPSAGRILPSLT